MPVGSLCDTHDTPHLPPVGGKGFRVAAHRQLKSSWQHPGIALGSSDFLPIEMGGRGGGEALRSLERGFLRMHCTRWRPGCWIYFRDGSRMFSRSSGTDVRQASSGSARSL